MMEGVDREQAASQSMLTAHNTTTTTEKGTKQTNKAKETLPTHDEPQRHLTEPSMNLGALARSLSNSLRFGVGSKKQLESTAESETPTATVSSSLANSDEIFSPETNERASEGNRKSTETPSASGRRRHSKSITKLRQQQPLYKQQVEEILLKISELEHTLYENQQQEFDMRMALEQQTERINELDFSLDTEKMRNQRLVHLLRGIDTDSPSDSEPETDMLNGLRMQSNAGEMYGSISPLLMQQR